MKKEVGNMFCSFCGKSRLETKRLISSPDGLSFICDECIITCKDILVEEDASKGSDKIELPTPEVIKSKLDDYVIGQNEAKRVLSVAVYNHYKRINYNIDAKSKKEGIDFIDIDKSNVLLIGPTGSGKTLLAKTLARVLKVPFAQADATTLTEAGYVGEDVENILLKLIQNADYDIKKAERGIIYIDEIDKITKKGENRSITRDVSGEGVQQALLKIIEGTVASVPPQGGRKHPHQELMQIDTSNILFICGGAFVGLQGIIEKRISNSSFGFNSLISEQDSESTGEVLRKIQPLDLIKYGLIPEFIGRMPIVVGLDDLSEDALIEIMQKPKNAITKQYKEMFKIDGVDIEFEPSAIRAVAKEAIKLKTGARGLRTILENCMLDLMFLTPSDKKISKIIIAEETITKNAQPQIIKNKVKGKGEKQPANHIKGEKQENSQKKNENQETA